MLSRSVQDSMQPSGSVPMEICWASAAAGARTSKHVTLTASINQPHFIFPLPSDAMIRERAAYSPSLCRGYSLLSTPRECTSQSAHSAAVPGLGPALKGPRPPREEAPEACRAALSKFHCPGAPGVS